MNEASRRADLRTPAINTTPSKFTLETFLQNTPNPQYRPRDFSGRTKTEQRLSGALFRKLKKQRVSPETQEPKKSRQGQKLLAKFKQNSQSHMKISVSNSKKVRPNFSEPKNKFCTRQVKTVSLQLNR